MNDVVEMVVVKRVKRTVKQLLGDDTMTQYIQSIRVPDWALLNLNQMKAIKKLVFGLVNDIIGISKVPFSLQGYSTNMLQLIAFFQNMYLSLFVIVGFE
jgi:hypothetical protein